MIRRLLALFCLCVTATRADILIPLDSTWQYHKGRSAPPAAWLNPDFDDSTWSQGRTPIYYGENLNGTLLTDMRNNYTTVYLRRTFVVEDATVIDRLAVRFHVDDGLIIWINGTEVTRFNVAPGISSFSSVAQGTIEPTWVTNSLPAPSRYLRTGTNLIAALLLNRPVSSSDIVFNLQLESTSDRNPPVIASILPEPGRINALTSISIGFSEPVQGVTAEDLLINNQPALSVSNSGGVYTFTFPQADYGVVDITWEAATDITDFADPPHPFVSTNWSYLLVDDVPPFLVSTLPPRGLALRALSEIEVKFSEAVTGIKASDLLLNGRPATSLVQRSAGGYLFQFEGAPQGLAQVSWAAGHEIFDFASNRFAGGSWSYSVDSNLPATDIVISEFLASAENSGGLRDEDGELHDWIEIYNRGSTSASLAGWSLTDDPDEPALWVFPDILIPAGARFVVFASGKNRSSGTTVHTSFKLSQEGEYLALFNNASPRQPVTEFREGYPVQRNDHSYGLDPEGQWRYFPSPTPGQPNGESGIFGIAPDPVASWPRGYADAPFTLAISNTLPGATIYYTLDGSPPTPGTARIYSQALFITNTTILRAAAYHPGYLPSKVVTYSYIFPDDIIRQSNSPPGYPVGPEVMSGYPSDYEMDPEIVNDPAYSTQMKAALQALPILSIAMKIDDMFGAANGIYTHPLSRGPQWERPCSVEFIPPGEDDFQVDCGIQIQGNAAREPIKQPKHPMRITFKGDYGPKSLSYRMFPDSPVDKFDTLILRADFNYSWLHWNPTQRIRAQRIRDSWMKDTMRAMGGLASHNRYVHLFINGLYWGIYDPTERPDGSFGEAYFGGDKDDYDVINEGAVVDGSSVAYNQLLAATDISTLARYEAIKSLVDMPQFIDYMLLHFYVGHEDWGNNKNWYMIRPKDGSRGFFYVPWDGEMILGEPNVNRVANSDVPSGLHTRLAANAQYRLDFADRVHKHFFNDGALTPAQNIARWQKRSREIELPIIAESARWGDYRRDVHRYQNPPYELYTRDVQWRAEQERLLNSYFPSRTTTVLAQLRNAGLYPALEAPSFTHSGGQISPGERLGISAPAGTIYYTTDGADPRVYATGHISATARAYTTELILTETTHVKARAWANGVWSALMEATFNVGYSRFPLRITELMYHPTPPGDPLEFIELENIGPLPFDAAGYSIEGVDYIFPPGSIIQPGEIIVLASGEDPVAFAARYPGVPVFGRFGGQLVNRGERIALVAPGGMTVLSVDYSDEAAWPQEADGEGHSLEIVDPSGNPDDPANWQASATVNGSPGRRNSASTEPEIHISEILAISTTGSDWLELHNRGERTVDISGWSIARSSNVESFVFPAGTTMLAGARLLVHCDRQTNAPGFHAPFALAAEGLTIVLRDANGRFAHRISYGPQAPDYSYGIVGEKWRLCLPTPGESNEEAALESPGQVKINEWLADPLPGEPDWLELYNPASRPVSIEGCAFQTANGLFEVTIPVFIPAKGFVRLFADPDPGFDHLDFKLPAAGTTLTLHGPTGTVLDTVTYGAQAENISQGRFPDGSANIVSFPFGPSPGAPNTLSFPIRHVVMAEHFGLQWNARPGSRYRVEVSSDLHSWTTLEEIVAVNSLAEAKDSRSALRRYYRVIALP